MVEQREQADCQEVQELQALIAVGSNLPLDGRSPAEMVLEAMERVAPIGPGVSRSRLFRTPAFPPGAGPDFVNAAFAMPWAGSARDLLGKLNAVEAEMGRTRKARWEARIMDLDLIALGQQVFPDPQTQADWVALPPEEAAREVPGELILPHPRMAERGFVLVPLADVAADWRHPLTGFSVAQMLAARPRDELDEIFPLPDQPDP